MKIVAQLLALAVKVGRWLLHHLREQGRDLAIGYISGKIGDFKRRLARARTYRRKRWLTGRIRRWSAVLEALKGYIARDVADSVEEAIVKAVEKRLPMEVA